jgi:hypothetical protein
MLNLPSITELDWNKSLKIAMGFARAVEYLHTQDPPLIVKDLKLANITSKSSSINEYWPSNHLKKHHVRSESNKVLREYLEGAYFGAKLLLR